MMFYIIDLQVGKTANQYLQMRLKSIVGKKELACMKKGAFLINTARGSLVDEAALYNSLSSNHIPILCKVPGDDYA